MSLHKILATYIYVCVCLQDKDIFRHKSWLTGWSNKVNKYVFNQLTRTIDLTLAEALKHNKWNKKNASHNRWFPNTDKHTQFAHSCLQINQSKSLWARLFHFCLTERKKINKKCHSLTYAAKRFGWRGQIPCLLEWQFFPLIRPELRRAKQAAGRLPKPHTGIAAIMPFQRAQAIRELNYPSWSLLLTLS